MHKVSLNKVLRHHTTLDDEVEHSLRGACTMMEQYLPSRGRQALAVFRFNAMIIRLMFWKEKERILVQQTDKDFFSVRITTQDQQDTRVSVDVNGSNVCRKLLQCLPAQRIVQTVLQCSLSGILGIRHEYAMYVGDSTRNDRGWEQHITSFGAAARADFERYLNSVLQEKEQRYTVSNARPTYHMGKNGHSRPCILFHLVPVQPGAPPLETLDTTEELELIQSFASRFERKSMSAPEPFGPSYRLRKITKQNFEKPVIVHGIQKREDQEEQHYVKFPYSMPCTAFCRPLVLFEEEGAFFDVDLGSTRLCVQLFRYDGTLWCRRVLPPLLPMDMGYWVHLGLEPPVPTDGCNLLTTTGMVEFCCQVWPVNRALSFVVLWEQDVYELMDESTLAVLLLLSKGQDILVPRVAWARIGGRQPLHCNTDCFRARVTKSATGKPVIQEIQRVRRISSPSLEKAWLELDNSHRTLFCRLCIHRPLVARDHVPFLLRQPRCLYVVPSPPPDLYRLAFVLGMYVGMRHVYPARIVTRHAGVWRAVLSRDECLARSLGAHVVVESYEMCRDEVLLASVLILDARDGEDLSVGDQWRAHNIVWFGDPKMESPSFLTVVGLHCDTLTKKELRHTYLCMYLYKTLSWPSVPEGRALSVDVPMSAVARDCLQHFDIFHSLIVDQRDDSVLRQFYHSVRGGVPINWPRATAFIYKMRFAWSLLRSTYDVGCDDGNSRTRKRRRSELGCGMCLDYHLVDTCRQLDCGHVFCVSCLRSWHEQNENHGRQPVCALRCDNALYSEKAVNQDNIGRITRLPYDLFEGADRSPAFDVNLQLERLLSEHAGPRLVVTDQNYVSKEWNKLGVDDTEVVHGQIYWIDRRVLERRAHFSLELTIRFDMAAVACPLTRGVKMRVRAVSRLVVDVNIQFNPSWVVASDGLFA